jgi:hypothetical protein
MWAVWNASCGKRSIWTQVGDVSPPGGPERPLADKWPGGDMFDFDRARDERGAGVNTGGFGRLDVRRPRDERGAGVYVGGGVLALIVIVLLLILIF